MTVSLASAGRDCSSVAKGEKHSVAGLSCLRFFTGACQLDHAAAGWERARVLGLSSLWRREAASQEKGAIETSWRRIETRGMRTCCGRGSERYNR